MNLITFLNILHLCVIITAVKDDLTKHPNWKLINEEDCGVTLTDRIIGGSIATLGQYPWIANLGYTIPAKKPMPPEFHCAGSLINNRYVLTVAQCVTLTDGRELTLIRLGQLNTGIDEQCYESELCAEPAQDFKPEDIIWHENWGSEVINDLALIRLDETVTYSRWINPICLPQGDLLRHPIKGQSYEVAGWGEMTSSPILRTVNLRVVPFKNCELIFGQSTLNGTKQVCAGGKKGEGTCFADAGDPMMKVTEMEDGPKYVLIGCASACPKTCPAKNGPTVFTRVPYHMPWILDHINTADDLTIHRNWKLINEEDCGVILTDRIIGGSNATLGQYPWMAILGYIINTNMAMPPKFKCGGSLINSRYVLTAAHCVTDLPTTLKLTLIRLGEHNKLTAPDCDDSGLCAAPAQDFKYEKCIWHENFGNDIYDIALIRLDRTVTYSRWISPICLPQGDLLKESFLREQVEVAGWGIYQMGLKNTSTILRTVKLPVVPFKLCIKVFGHAYMDNAKQMCVGGQAGVDSCKGDSGGPLMKVMQMGNVPKYVAIGCVSFGTDTCDVPADNSPGVNTRVTYFMRWILDNISDEDETPPKSKLMNEEDCG